MSKLENIVGEICKTLFPIYEELIFGNPKSSIAICTLSNISLLKKIGNSELMEKIFVVGRLLSENKGIDKLVKNVISNKNIETIIICGNEVLGHKSGHSLLELYENGIDENGRIIGSKSPKPYLTISLNELKKFRNQVSIINRIGITNIEKLIPLIE